MLYYVKHSSWLDFPKGKEDEFSFLSKGTRRDLNLYHNLPKENILERKSYLKILQQKIKLECTKEDKKKTHILSHLGSKDKLFRKFRFSF